MYCTRCGKKLRDDARFCPSCGATISEQNPSSFKSTGESSRAGQSLDDAGLDASLSAQTTASEKTTSLVSAVSNTRRRSQRHMPLVVLVALALALTSVIAFAAHYVYTQYIAPQQMAGTEQAQISRSQTGDEQDSGNQPQETSEVSAALNAFARIKDEYQLAYRTETNGEPIDEDFIKTKLAHVFPNVYAVYARADQTVETDYILKYIYAVADINSDGVPEMIVSTRTDDGEISSNPLAIWSFSGNESVLIAEANRVLGLTVCEDGIIREEGMTYVLTTRCYRPKNSEDLEITEIGNDGMATSVNNEIAVTSVTWDMGTGTTTYREEDGTESTFHDETDSESSSYHRISKEISERYRPIDMTQFDWQPLVSGAQED